MKGRVGRPLVAVVLAVVVLLSLAPAVLGARSWCDTDLGPMATIAEEVNAPEAWHAERLIVPVPSDAVSVDKGGTNPNK